jgi:cytochrome c553
MHMRCVALILGLAAVVFGQSPAQTVLATNCTSCHGAAQMSGLDLRQRETALKGGKRGPAIVPGKPEESLLYRAVMRQGDLQMPPGKKALSIEDVASLKSWIWRPEKMRLLLSPLLVSYLTYSRLRKVLSWLGDGGMLVIAMSVCHSMSTNVELLDSDFDIADLGFRTS